MKHSAAILMSTFLLCTASIQAQEIAQWNGTNRDGYFPSANLMTQWPENGPTLLWSTETLGDGFGAVAVCPDMLFVNGKIDSIGYTFAFDLKGNLRWKAPNGNEFTGREYSANFPGPRATPTIYNGLVYTCSGNGRIACLDKNTGKEKWAVDMLRDFKGVMDQHGYCESLLVDDKKVYCLPGGIEKNVVALDRLTGKEIWSTKAFSDSATYCSPMMIKLPQRDILVTFSGHHLLGIDASNGELLWSEVQDYHRYHQHCNTPIFDNGNLYYMSGEGNGVVKVVISPDGKSIKDAWSNKKTNNVYNGFVKKDGLLFSSNKTQRLKSIDCQTGEPVDSIRMTKGGLIRSDSIMICYSENGDVNLIRTNGPHMEQTGKFKVEKGTKEHFAHPVIANGVLYIRHGQALMAYDITKH